MTATVSTTATAEGAAVNGTMTGTFGVRLRWAAGAVPAFTIGWASAQAMGEVVGEAWGGDFLHALGHTVGTTVVVGLVSVAGWLVLRDRARWASRWALAGTAGSLVGLVLYVPILAAAPDAIAGITLALTLHLPLLMAATFQARALRGHLRQPRRWALAWFVGIVLGVTVAWFAAATARRCVGRVRAPGAPEGTGLLVAHGSQKRARGGALRPVDSVDRSPGQSLQLQEA